MMFHEQWKCILDDDFMEAYVHGIVIDCLDAVVRRFYLRVFIYSSDYPEKCASKFILERSIMSYNALIEQLPPPSET